MPHLRFLPALTLLALALSPVRVDARAAGMAVIEPAAIAWGEELTWTELETGMPQEQAAPALASFGPFRVTEPASADMIGMVDSRSPQQFAAMLKAYPAIRTLRMIECPGSEDDEANLVLARMVRAARIDTIVPEGGSVRSGAVELFLAGVRRQADSRAEFAVHSWRDDLGREADDLAEDDPIHREYLDFYRDMRISDALARRFYALSNSVPFDQALYLAPSQLAHMGLLELAPASGTI